MALLLFLGLVPFCGTRAAWAISIAQSCIKHDWGSLFQARKNNWGAKKPPWQIQSGHPMPLVVLLDVSYQLQKP